MSSNVDEQQLGIFALVSYVTDPLGSYLKQLQQSLPGEETPQPHITILPPRPLVLPLENVSQKAKEKLEGVACFDVALGEVKLFPETHVLYLEIADGHRDLQALHAILNTGVLHHAERFEYSPHVTINTPFTGEDLEKSRQKAEDSWKGSGFSKRFTISHVSFVWQSSGEDEQWQRLWTFPLAEPRERAATQTTSRTY